MRTVLDRHPVLVYTLARLALFAAVAAVLAAVGLRSIALVVAALVVSGGLSLWLLSRPRDVMSHAVADRLERIRTGIDGSAASEDDDVLLEDTDRDRTDHRDTDRATADGAEAPGRGTAAREIG